MTSTQFDLETAERLERIARNPNPRRLSWVKASWTWGRAFIQNLDRKAAVDSFRNVLAVVGFSTVIGDFATMRVWMAVPCALVAVGMWYADYMRHF